VEVMKEVKRKEELMKQVDDYYWNRVEEQEGIVDLKWSENEI
jgi:hypothetical protein